MLKKKKHNNNKVQVNTQRQALTDQTNTKPTSDPKGGGATGELDR